MCTGAKQWTVSSAVSTSQLLDYSATQHSVNLPRWCQVVRPELTIIGRREQWELSETHDAFLLFDWPGPTRGARRVLKKKSTSLPPLSQPTPWWCFFSRREERKSEASLPALQVHWSSRSTLPWRFHLPGVLEKLIKTNNSMMAQKCLNDDILLDSMHSNEMNNVF